MERPGHKAAGPPQQLCSPSKGAGAKQDATPKQQVWDAKQDATHNKSPFAQPYFTIKLLTRGYNRYQWSPDCTQTPPHCTPQGIAFIALQLMVPKDRTAFAAVVSLAGRVFSAAAIRVGSTLCRAQQPGGIS